MLLGVTVLLLLIGITSKSGLRCLSVTNDFQIGVTRCGGIIDVRLVFFNNKEYGPYRGSIIAVADDEGNIHPPRIRESARGDGFAVYWRYFRWKEGTWGINNPVLWTLMVSLWCPFILFSVLPAAWWFRRRRQAPRGRCSVEGAAQVNGQGG
jgi:hypothetical protein